MNDGEATAGEAAGCEKANEATAARAAEAEESRGAEAEAEASAAAALAAEKWQAEPISP